MMRAALSSALSSIFARPHIKMRAEHREIPIGAGYWAVRVTPKGTKLVPADRSGQPTLEQLTARGKLKPLRAVVTKPATRRARRNVPIQTHS